jgi:hypothetical protein
MGRLVMGRLVMGRLVMRPGNHIVKQSLRWMVHSNSPSSSAAPDVIINVPIFPSL